MATARLILLWQFIGLTSTDLVQRLLNPLYKLRSPISASSQCPNHPNQAQKETWFADLNVGILKRAFEVLPIVKYFNPKTMKPDTNQFHEAVKDKISDSGRQSLAHKAVLNLFGQAQSLYKTLDFVTSQNLAHFKSANKYLSQRQENDAISLTAIYAGNLRTQFIHDLVKQDTTINDQERLVLEMTLDLYKATCEANYGALGNPRWIDD